MTVSWLATLDLLESLQATHIVPGHSTSTDPFKNNAAKVIGFTKSYVKFFQSVIQSKGVNYYTPQEIINQFGVAFSGLNNTLSDFLLDATAGEFGINGTRQIFYHPVDEFTNATALDGYIL